MCGVVVWRGGWARQVFALVVLTRVGSQRCKPHHRAPPYLYATMLCAVDHDTGMFDRAFADRHAVSSPGLLSDVAVAPCAHAN
jgi:hypothetical protein